MNVEYDINELSSMINELAEKCKLCTQKIEKLQEELGQLRAIPVDDIFKTYEKQSDFKKQIDKKSASIKRLFKKYNELFEQQTKYDSMRFQLIEYNMQLNERISKLDQDIEELNEDINIYFKYASFHNLVLKKQDKLRHLLLEKKELEYERSIIFDRSKMKENSDTQEFDITIEDDVIEEEKQLKENIGSTNKDLLKIDVVSYGNLSLKELFELNNNGFITDEEFGLILNKRYENCERLVPKASVSSNHEQNVFDSSLESNNEAKEEPVVEPIKSKKKSSKLTWKAYAAIAGGVVASSLVHFTTNGFGNVFVSGIATKVNSNIDKIKEKNEVFSAVSDVGEKMEVVDITDAKPTLKQKVKNKLNKISNYLYSKEGLNELSYFLKALYTTSMALGAFTAIQGLTNSNSYVDNSQDVNNEVTLPPPSGPEKPLIIEHIYNNASDAVSQSNSKIPLEWVDPQYGSHVALEKDGAFLIKDSKGSPQGWIPFDESIKIGDMVDTSGRGM